MGFFVPSLADVMQVLVQNRVSLTLPQLPPVVQNSRFVDGASDWHESDTSEPAA